MRVVLISTYELGHQPFGLASPAAWLRETGATVQCVDLAVEPLPEAAIRAADLVALYVPMHTATRLATALIPQLHALNPAAHLCCYGLYAPMNAELLHDLGVQTIIGGEFESELVALVKQEPGARSQEAGDTEHSAPRVLSQPSALSLQSSFISLDKQQFITPDRSVLPPLPAYAWVQMAGGRRRTAGYTEASRGCKHLCRHCPIVPVYNGQFRIVQREVVLADIRQQVAAGAQHITFGDPDFFNGPGHAIPLVQALHAEFPALTYDATIKVEHLLKHAALLPTLRDTGCLFVTSAVESADDAVLERFDKRHTRADFVRAALLLREAGLALNPTFVTFTPWTTPRTYRDLLALIVELDLVEHVAPIQYAIRLLIPAGSRLLELAEVQSLVGAFDAAALAYPWQHPDSRVDQLYSDVLAAVKRGAALREPRTATFERVWKLAQAAVDSNKRATTEWQHGPPRTAIPHMSEPWYC